jgi:hypothetical protein
MIDITTETLVSLNDARQHPAMRNADGSEPSSEKLRRLATSGVAGVVLETVVLPAGRHTSREAILRFVERLTNPSSTPMPSVVRPARTPSQKKASLSRADRVLAAARI